MEKRIWIDGCFDFAHHGHAGAMLQARQLGTQLYVGIHTDEDILVNKGPTVMTLQERIVAVEACKWCSIAVPGAPYVTSPQVMDEYGCWYVVHGDDITTDANGEDCYQLVKDLGRFLVVKRTENISTTDLVGRMLLFTKTHHIKSISDGDYDNYSNGVVSNQLLSSASMNKFKAYATDATGLTSNSIVLCHTPSKLHQLIAPSDAISTKLHNGIIYIDGGFDLFNTGHINALKIVSRIAQVNSYAVMVGVNNDNEVNLNKGWNYPIMNVFERSLCVLQCRYVDGIVVGAPYIPSAQFLEQLPGVVVGVYHGPTSESAVDTATGAQIDPYREVRGLYHNLGRHEFDGVSTEGIVARVLDNKKQYEERQRKKGWKREY